MVETATGAADGRQEAQALLAAQSGARLRQGAPKPSAPRACAVCCGRYESPS